MGNLPLTIFMVLAVLILCFYVGDKVATRREIKAKLEHLRKKYPDGYKSERISFLQHEEHRILLLDLTYCATEEAVDSIQKYKDLISTQRANSVLTIIDLTDGQFSLEAVEQLKLVISQNRPYVARAAFVGVASLPREEKYPLWHASVGLPEFYTRDDAIDFVEHDDEYLIYHQEHKPETLTKDGSYNWALLWELLARLLRYPDDQYWTTVQRCLPFFTYARTRKARLMTSFADDIKDLSLEELQRLYTEAFNLNPACSLELGRQLHLEDRKRWDMISWIEYRVSRLEFKLQADMIAWMDYSIGRLEFKLPPSIQNRTTPILYRPLDHISVGLMLMTVVGGATGEDIRDAWLYPAMQNLMVAMKGSKSPFEKLVKVVAITVTPG